jgi:hypothetical protein
MENALSNVKSGAIKYLNTEYVKLIVNILYLAKGVYYEKVYDANLCKRECGGSRALFKGF